MYLELKFEDYREAAVCCPCVVRKRPGQPHGKPYFTGCCGVSQVSLEISATQWPLRAGATSRGTQNIVTLVLFYLLVRSTKTRIRVSAD